MSIIKQDQKRLDNIAKAYWNTSGEMRQMWGRKDIKQNTLQVGRNNGVGDVVTETHFMFVV
jgi:tetrahydromethanopterin S-methyltransferase subunit G